MSDMKESITDSEGRVFYRHSVSFPFFDEEVKREQTISFYIWATHIEHAQQMVDAIKEGATLDGQVG